MSNEHFDVLIIGAGVSGIGTACHLARRCPDKSYAILERRDEIGGTWDLFRYPGIRSDSDMYTFGFEFAPWKGGKMLADGPAIKDYVDETAQAHNVNRHIRFGRKVVSAEWSSADARWTVTAVREASGKTETCTAGFVVSASGYYRYDAGHRPEFPGEETFGGQIIHPQHWPEDLDYAGKQVVVIGSGATAVTLVPAMAGEAGKITMLQRSPSYIFPLPAIDQLSEALYKVLPDQWVYDFARLRNIHMQRLIYNTSQRFPGFSKWLLQKMARRGLGPDFDMRHFDPDYGPWDQRMCVIPDGDLFKALRRHDVEIVTDHIETFTADGIRLASGRDLKADIIISATGLDVQLLGEVAVRVDGELLDVSERMLYKATMIEGVPNAAVIFGYINASWTLKVDIVGRYLCRLLAHMDKHGHDVATPRDHEGCQEQGSALDALSSGYIRRVAHRRRR
ncbi:MAG: NAD(P)/FAD-dependent oxidoreductase, partial [Salinisphaera sp.]|nr:NAD(P)/FAD-dependent oxidoreductase [Salinisphaera sp.]